MDIPFAFTFSFSGIVSYFWIFSLSLISLLLYLFSKAVKAVKGISIVTIPNNSNIDTQLFLAVLRSETRRTCCACCGIAQDVKIKLVPCDDCDLVKYCSDKCQKNDSAEHAEECKMRAAELVRDELLFKQPEGSHLGDCPICCLPMPLDLKKCNMMMCCSTSICKGCDYTNQRRIVRASKVKSCPFCRAPMPLTDEEVDILLMKRIEANDPDAMNWKGNRDYDNGDYSAALELFTKAAKMGDEDSHYRLSIMYYNGTGVEKNWKKENYHLEEAAIGGHPLARYTLGLNEWNRRRNFERAVKHFIIAATLGQDEAIKSLMDMFKEGSVEKDELAAALRAHQAAVDATKSPQREAAEQFWRKQAAKKA